jgi:hypothetical protein
VDTIATFVQYIQFYEATNVFELERAATAVTNETTPFSS